MAAVLTKRRRVNQAEVGETGKKKVFYLVVSVIRRHYSVLIKGEKLPDYI